MNSGLNNSRGSEYTYFFCRNKQNGNCPTPPVNVIRIEDAVEDHYATIRFPSDRGPSVYPSIDRNRDEGARCHYWLENGQVRWV